MSARFTSAHVPAWAKWLGGVVATLTLAVVVFLWVFNWNMLRAPLAHEASRISGRPISIDGDLKVHLWSWTPSAEIGGLKIGNPTWMRGGLLADIRTVIIKVDLHRLLTGQVELPLLDLETPKISAFNDATDRSNWRPAKAGADFKLPSIDQFVVHNGDLKLVDEKRKLIINGTLQSQESNQGAPGSFRLVGGGSIDRYPFLLSVDGGPLLYLRHDRPYPFDADLRASATHVVARGSLPQPFDFDHVRTTLNVSGANFADLYYLTGLALPNTGAYRLSGQVARNGKLYQFSQVNGQVGRSDLEGQFLVDDRGPRLAMRADLRSRSVDYRDLATLVGAPPQQALQTPSQRTEAVSLAVQNRLLPDTTLDVRRVRAMDGVFRYRADTVRAAAHLPLRRVALDVTLDHGVMNLNPVSLTFPRGLLAGRVTIDARPNTPKEDVDLKVSNVRLEDFIQGGPNPPLEGLLEARAKLHGYGDSVHKAASTADGDVTLVVPHGQIRRALAELLGIDVVQGLGLLWSKSQSETPVRCAVVDFHSTGGVLQARNFIIDSGPVLASGQGVVNMDKETLDLVIQGRPKQFRLIRLRAPITVTGSLKAPRIGVKAGGAPAQAAIAIALGALLTPVALVLPFVDPGLAHDADCVGLLNQAKRMGAPVKTQPASYIQAQAAPWRGPKP